MTHMTSLSASCWNCNSVLKAFKTSFEIDQLSGDDSSSSSKFGSSDEEVHELEVTGIQRYQFQPKRDSHVNKYS